MAPEGAVNPRQGRRNCSYEQLFSSLHSSVNSSSCFYSSMSVRKRKWRLCTSLLFPISMVPSGSSSWVASRVSCLRTWKEVGPWGKVGGEEMAVEDRLFWRSLIHRVTISQRQPGVKEGGLQNSRPATPTYFLCSRVSPFWSDR